MLPEVVELLQVISPALARAEVERHRPDLLECMERWGDAWREHARSLGITCPPALVELGDAMAEVYVHVGANHGWDLLTPDGSREAREGLLSLAVAFPALGARPGMAPVFGQDGDLLLLAGDGRIHGFTHDDWENDGVRAGSFEELLRILAAEARARRGRARR